MAGHIVIELSRYLKNIFFVFLFFQKNLILIIFLNVLPRLM